MIGIELAALTFDVVGKILIGIMAILVHRRLWKEHKIDRKVLQELRLEQNVAFIGIAFIIIGYLLELSTMY